MRSDESIMTGISIVCVYNDLAVRRECLDRSIEAYVGDIDVDFVTVDNTTHAFPTAGAALNHGARKARHELVAFVHQDVYLHSINRLVDAGLAFKDGTWGLLGANGVTSKGENVGRLRDRAQVIGAHTPSPVEVDSVDEVLFMAPLDLVLRYPITEDFALAWHAYAVEYGLRLRELGKRVGAVDLAITHNSLTINLDKLDLARRQVGALYPQLGPICTTCGTIGSSESRWRDLPILRLHRWRLRWLQQSLLALKARRRIDAPVVLSDIRHELDLLPFSDESPLHLVNVDHAGGFAEFASEPLRLTRYGRPVVNYTVRTGSQMLNLVNQLPQTSRILVVGVTFEDLGALRSRSGSGRDWLVGIHPAEMWLLGGVGASERPSQWSRPQAVPLGFNRSDLP